MKDDKLSLYENICNASLPMACADSTINIKNMQNQVCVTTGTVLWIQSFVVLITFFFFQIEQDESNCWLHICHYAI